MTCIVHNAPCADESYPAYWRNFLVMKQTALIQSQRCIV